MRSKSKGEALKKSLGVDDSVPLVQVDVLRYDEVEAAVRDAKVVVNITGPYWLYGPNVVKCVFLKIFAARVPEGLLMLACRACAMHGKRYVDLAGEVPYQRKIITE